MIYLLVRMGKMFIKPIKKIKGEIFVPGDKSISHRAVMIGAIANGKTTIKNFLPSADCLATVSCFSKLGIEIQGRGKQIVIKGKGLKGLWAPDKILDVGNSGTTIRLLSGILAGQDFEVEITGDRSIQKRPMGRIAVPLRMMGADVEGRRQEAGGNRPEEIFPPLKIFGGKLKAISYEMPVASAQVKSAVLLAGLFADGETAVIEKVASRDHTERMLEHFGAEIKVNGHQSSVVGLNEYDGVKVDVPGDISSAAFFMVAAAIVPNSELVIKEVGVNPTRTGIIDILHRMGAKVEVMDEETLSNEPRAAIRIRSSKLTAIKIDGSIVPRIIDEIPIIAVAATQADGVTEIRGAKELRIKESDRIKTVAAELRKFGAKVEELEDGLIITGPTKLKGAKVKSCGDHRIAMAMAIAGLAADGETAIEDPECIETSFPGFNEILRKISQ